MASHHKKKKQRAPNLETLEPRMVMAVDFATEFSINYFQDDSSSSMYAALASAHNQTGLTVARNTYGLDGHGQTVVVIDSGIAYDHTSLGRGLGAGFRVQGGWDFAENDANPYDDGPVGAHGTHVAGIIGSSHIVQNGVAPGVDLVALRVFNDAGQGSFQWVEQALQWVHTHRNDFRNPITTVNLSIGSNWNSSTLPNWANLEEEFSQLKQDGIFTAVAAGNSFLQYGTTGLSYPAVSSSVVAVASLDADGRLSSYSQRASSVIAAPGRGIMSTVPDYRGNLNGVADDFLRMSGTSMAAPYVAGASVLIRQALEFSGAQNITQDTIYQWMRNTADSVYDAFTGQSYFKLNLQRALDSIMPRDDVGSTLQTAADLGALGTTRTIVGTFNTVSDQDCFQFTASHTGSVTFKLRDGQTGQWQVVAGGNESASGGSFTFQVVAGQKYTLSLGATGSVAHYSVDVATASSNVTINTPLSKIFDEAFYLARYSDVRAAVQSGQFSSALEHYVRVGQREGRSPSVVFDQAYYLSRYSDVRAQVQSGVYASAAEHYAKLGQYQRRSGSAWFDEAYYLSANADVRSLVAQGKYASGAEHYLKVGMAQGRDPSRQFSESGYLARYSDVRLLVQQGRYRSGLEHYVQVGRSEGRLTVAVGTRVSPATVAVVGPSLSGTASTSSLRPASVDDQTLAAQPQNAAAPTTFETPLAVVGPVSMSIDTWQSTLAWAGQSVAALNATGPQTGYDNLPWAVRQQSLDQLLSGALASQADHLNVAELALADALAGNLQADQQAASWSSDHDTSVGLLCAEVADHHWQQQVEELLAALELHAAQ